MQSKPGYTSPTLSTKFRSTASARLLVAALILAWIPVLRLAAQDTAIARGDSLRMAGDLLGAMTTYANAFRSNPTDGALAYKLASTHALHGQFPDSAFHYLNIALRTDDTMRPLWDADMYYLIDDERWHDIEDTQLDKLADQVDGTLDREYARELLRMRIVEWGYRYHITLAFRELGPESPILTALSKSMSEHHEQNLARLEPLLEEKGWPRLSSVGEDAAYAAGNVVNHSDLDVRQRFLPLLKEACEQEEADWSRYAHIYDRTELELGHPQLYGTQMELNEETGLYEPRELVEPDNVDARRAEKGMEPIAAQLDRFNESMQRDFGTGDG